MGPSTTELLPEDGIQATAPLTLDNAELEFPHGLARADVTEHIIRLQMVQGSKIVLAPQGLRHSPQCCLRDGLLQILN